MFELKNPLYPGMDVVLGCSVSLAEAEIRVLSQRESLTIAGQDCSEVLLFVTTFADSAPPRRQEFKLIDIDRIRSLAHMMEQQLARMRGAGGHTSSPRPFTAWS